MYMTHAWIEGILYVHAALAFHNAQLEASAFSEEFDAEGFEDLTLPKVDIIHKVRHIPLLFSSLLIVVSYVQRAGALLTEWKKALMNDESANKVIVTGTKSGTKRKAVSISFFSLVLLVLGELIVRAGLRMPVLTSQKYEVNMKTGLSLK
jgi:hypothetical protein